MNFQQLEYILAVDRHQHFGRAAESCHVTQPTLSMMIIQLEDEMGVKIFDRKSKPVKPTSIGQDIIDKAHVLLQHKRELEEIAHCNDSAVDGELAIGIIPTLAPYILPLFIDTFSKKYPSIHLHIEETNTDAILQKLRSEQLDVGILATPLQASGIYEEVLFYEAFFLYGNMDTTKHYLMPEEIETNKLLLLEEGHCLSTQVKHLCSLQKAQDNKIHYRIGSLETLKILVEQNQGITILPELAINHLSSARRKQIKAFSPPVPAREISLVGRYPTIKKSLKKALKEVILSCIPAKMKDPSVYHRINAIS